MRQLLWLVTIWTLLLTGAKDCYGQPDDARQLVDKMLQEAISSWTSMKSGFPFSAVVQARIAVRGSEQEKEQVRQQIWKYRTDGSSRAVEVYAQRSPDSSDEGAFDFVISENADYAFKLTRALPEEEWRVEEASRLYKDDGYARAAIDSSTRQFLSSSCYLQDLFYIEVLVKSKGFNVESSTVDELDGKTRLNIKFDFNSQAEDRLTDVPRFLQARIMKTELPKVSGTLSVLPNRFWALSSYDFTAKIKIPGQDSFEEYRVTAAIKYIDDDLSTVPIPRSIKSVTENTKGMRVVAEIDVSDLSRRAPNVESFRLPEYGLSEGIVAMVDPNSLRSTSWSFASKLIFAGNVLLLIALLIYFYRHSKKQS